MIIQRYFGSMTKEEALQWATDLESGKFGQARSRLRTVEGYCCLGVLATTQCGIDPPVSEPGLGNEDQPAYAAIETRFGYNFLPAPFWKLNDLEKLSFPEIAAEIRAAWNSA